MLYLIKMAMCTILTVKVIHDQVRERISITLKITEHENSFCTDLK